LDPSSDLLKVVDSFFAPEGSLAKSLPKYEYRPEQVTMAKAIAEGVTRGQIHLIEAGTGVGKSLAYLVPLILHAVYESKRVFVATGTKTLQYQLMEKELPFLKKHLPVDFSYALCLGADNYLCERRLEALNPSSEQQALFGNTDEIGLLKQWSKECRHGLRTEIDFSVSPQTWFQACRIPELCAGQDCGKGGDCFYQRARRRMTKATVLVANHHLLFANMRADWEYLPPSQILVVDEAHHFDQVASDCLGVEISHRALRRVWEGLRGKDGAGCLLGSLVELPLETRQALLHEVAEVERKIHETLHWMHQDILDGAPRVPLSVDLAGKGLEHFLVPLSTLVADLKTVARRLEDEERALECEGYAVRLDRLLKEVKRILEFSDQDPWLLWCEELVPKAASQGAEGAGTTTAMAAFRATPIEPGDILSADLYSKFEASFLVSATLSIGQDFQFSQRRLGTVGEGVRTLALPSPFDHQNQLLIYTPPEMPEPSQTDLFLDEADREIASLVELATGGTFVLCTSYKMLNGLYELARDRPHSRTFREYGGSGGSKRKRKGTGFSGDEVLILRQGEASRETLLEAFKSGQKAVLFGASTFWQGVDVPGKDLELVVITRLPFQVPDDPVLEAKIDRCRKRGGNPFYEIQVPHAVTLFRQGLGRLIRSHTDRGVVAILDPRLSTKSYGRSFLEALPDCRLTQDLSEVKVFLRTTGENEQVPRH
jgi:ATP-dependent DNA helicase DinG